MVLSDFSKTYDVLRKKYGLPELQRLNEEFEIEKIDRDSEILLRVIRKVMMEKIMNSMGFLELLLTPVNAPRLYFNYIRSMTTEDKKHIEDLYEKLSQLSLSSLSLEIQYSEKEEAVMIQSIVSLWQSLKKSFSLLIAKVQKPHVSNGSKERSYFG
ncbi:MAG TPA: hypothetical protein VJK51_00630 [Candidatus Nanoarchaeia archaeon]|nr:hypothetical protein [Candidatus Nanoarchaeia archaeon]